MSTNTSTDTPSSIVRATTTMEAPRQRLGQVSCNFAPLQRKIVKAKRPPMPKTPPHRILTAAISRKAAAITPPKVSHLKSWTKKKLKNKNKSTMNKNITLPSPSTDILSNKAADYRLECKSKSRDLLEHTEYVFMGNEKYVPENVVTVRFHSSVREVKYKFCRCTKLKKVIMNEGLQRIPSTSFTNCVALEEVVIPSTLRWIGDSAFNNCYQLKKLVLNEGLLQLGAWTFGGCSSLECITIPSTVMIVQD